MIEVPIQEESNNDEVLVKVAEKLAEISEKLSEIFSVGYGAGLISGETNALLEAYKIDAAREAAKEANAYTDKMFNTIMGEGAHETLDTIAEISEALNNDKDFVNQLFFEIYNHAHFGMYAEEGHRHDDDYALIGHDHPEYATEGHTHPEYADYDHNHDDDYSPIGHDHGHQYADIEHDHPAYAEAVEKATTNAANIANLESTALYIKEYKYSAEVDGDYTSVTDGDYKGQYTKDTTVDIPGIVLGVVASATTEDDSAVKRIEVTSSVRYSQDTNSSPFYAQTKVNLKGYVPLSTAGKMEFIYTVYYIGLKGVNQ